MNALILDGSRRPSMVIAKSLGKQGIKITGADSYKHTSPLSYSRYVKNWLTYAAPEVNKTAFVNDLLEYLLNNPTDVIFPNYDFNLIPVLENKRLFESVTAVPFVDYKTFEITHNKPKTMKLAQKLGVPTPKEYTLDEAIEAKEHPYVIKPKSQTSGGKSTFITPDNYVFNNEQLLNMTYKLNLDYTIQEYVAGVGAGTAMLYNQGECKASFAYKRINELPITGGASTLRESIIHPKMIEYSKRLLDSLGWTGVAMVEYKLTESYEPVLMEINGRFWGSVALPVYSGINFPYMLYQIATDGDCETIHDYKIGVRSRWLIPGDIMHFLSYMKSDLPGKQRVLKDFFNFFRRGTYYDDFSLDDPMIPVGEGLLCMRHLWDVFTKKRKTSGEFV